MVTTEMIEIRWTHLADLEQPRGYAVDGSLSDGTTKRQYSTVQ